MTILYNRYTQAELDFAADTVAAALGTGFWVASLGETTPGPPPEPPPIPPYAGGGASSDAVTRPIVDYPLAADAVENGDWIRILDVSSGQEVRCTRAQFLAALGIAWDNITGKPGAFPPEDHDQPFSSITDLPGLLETLAALSSSGVLQSDGEAVSSAPATAFGLGLLAAEDAEASGLLTDAAPANLGGAAAVGTATEAARADHSHRLAEAIAYYTDPTTPGSGPSDTVPLFGMLNDAKSYGYAYRWQVDGGMDFIRRVNSVDTVLIALEEVSGTLHLGGPASANALTASGGVRVALGTFDNRLTLSGTNGTSNATISVTSVGGQAGLSLRSAGEGAVSLFAGSRGLARFIPTANAVNYLAFSSSITGMGVAIGPEGSDADIEMKLGGKAGGGLRLEWSDGKIGFFGSTPVARPVVTEATVPAVLAALSALNLIDNQSV